MNSLGINGEARRRKTETKKAFIMVMSDLMVRKSQNKILLSRCLFSVNRNMYFHFLEIRNLGVGSFKLSINESERAEQLEFFKKLHSQVCEATWHQSNCLKL